MMNRKMGFKDDGGPDTKFSSGMEKASFKTEEPRTSAVNKAREALSKR